MKTIGIAYIYKYIHQTVSAKSDEYSVDSAAVGRYQVFGSSNVSNDRSVNHIICTASLLLPANTQVSVIRVYVVQ